MDIDDNGNVFISYSNQNSSPYNFEIRKFHFDGTNIIQDFFYSPFSSTGSNTNQTQALDITSDKSGGVYIVGRYCGETYFSPSIFLTSTPASSITVYNSFILRIDSIGTILWAKTDFCDGLGSMFSVISNNNSEVYASGIAFIAGDRRKFIHKYNLSGSLMDSIYSSNVFMGTGDDDKLELGCDSNGDIYLFVGKSQYIAFNNLTLTGLPSSSLFKFTSSLVPLSAISLKNNFSSDVMNLENSSSGNVILNTYNSNDFEINNIRYSPINGQSQNIIKIDNNFNFIRNYYFGNGAQNTSVVDVSSNSNNLVMLFYKQGSFINNGITYNSGIYVVREQF